MPKKLQYFNVNGVAEPIRYILHYTKQEFEDVRYDWASWPDPEIKATLPYGQLPVYEEDGRVLNQSVAITKYVARGTDLIPSDPWEQAIVESTVLTIFDYWKIALPCLQQLMGPEKKAETQKKLDDTVEFYFSRINKQLSENGGYIIGKLSWGDFHLVGKVELNDLFLDTELGKLYPAVGEAVEKIRNLPGVKEYIGARGPYPKVNH